MGFDKTINARVFGVTNQNADLRLSVGDSSGGTFTGLANPLKDTLLWDRCMYVLQGVSVAGGATGGSYTVTIETDALRRTHGYTALPIARATIGPLTPTTVVMDNLHQSSASPVPTHIFVDQTATGGGIWFQCWAVAKQYRGTLGTAGSKTSERVIVGNMLVGTSTGRGGFSDDRGMTEDATFTFGTTGNAQGMHRMRHWDTALYWAIAGNSVAGTHDVDIIGTLGGNTISIATTGTGGALNVAGEKLALANNFYGQSPNPTGIIWTEVTAGGVSDARVVVMAKSGRGSLAKS